MKGEEQGNSYRRILKGTSIFGGVQIFNILINLVRGKFVAVILGPEGMGIASLFTSASLTIQRIASLGLNQVIVKETASVGDDRERHAALLTIIRRLIGYTAILGMLLCILLCVPLSRLTFGSEEYSWQFVVLGTGIGLMIAANGKLAILQGLQEVKKISKASIVGGLTGLFIGVPLYYIFGDKGIVPAIVALSLAMYIFYSLSLRSSQSIKPGSLKWKDHGPVLKRLLFLGIVLMASDMIGSLVNYLLNLFLRVHGSVDEVGLYQAANSVTNQYSGLVFAALAMDYFPRLSKVSSVNSEMKGVVNRQTEVVSLLIAPAVCLLILSSPLVIRVLLSEDFFSIIELIRWMGIGILLKALSFPMGYIAFAKGNKKVFFMLEGLAGNFLYLILGCIGFYFFGLLGLGYAMVVENFLILIIYYIVNNRLYEYKFSKEALIYSVIASAGGGLCFGSSFFADDALAYLFMSLVSSIVIVWSLIFIRRKYLNDSNGIEENEEYASRANPTEKECQEI